MGGQPRHARRQRVGHLREAAVLLRAHDRAVHLAGVHGPGGSVIAGGPEIAVVDDAVLRAGVQRRGDVHHLLFLAGLENGQVSHAADLFDPAVSSLDGDPVGARGAVGSVLHAARLRVLLLLLQRTSSSSSAFGTHIHSGKELQGAGGQVGRGVAGRRRDLRPRDAVGCARPLGQLAPRESAAVLSRNLVRRGETPADARRSIARVRLDRYLLVGEDGARALVRKRPLHRHADERRLGLLQLRHGSRVGLLAGRGLGAGAVAEGGGRLLLVRERLEGDGAGYRVGA